MTKKELEIEAEEYAKKNGSCFSKEYGIRYRTYMDCAESREKLIAELEKENAELKAKRIAELEKENTELKAKVGLSIYCENAQKNGKLCLGYGGDEDEPCEMCKNCIECECGYYQLGETEKDGQLTRAKELIRKLYPHVFQGMDFMELNDFNVLKAEAENFLKENEVEK